MSPASRRHLVILVSRHLLKMVPSSTQHITKQECSENPWVKASHSITSGVLPARLLGIYVSSPNSRCCRSPFGAYEATEDVQKMTGARLGGVPPSPLSPSLSMNPIEKMFKAHHLSSPTPPPRQDADEAVRILLNPPVIAPGEEARTEGRGH